MSDESLASVVEKLARGDQAAAEKVFRTYEPFLRQVVRRQLDTNMRAKFDSVDIVQSVWSDLLQGFRESAWSFDDTERLKAFLVRATRHRFLDRARRYRTCMRKEVSASARPRLDEAFPSNQPRPSQVLQAEELWDRMLAECHPPHRELLLLKREGFTIAEIASRTGLHEDSIRRILRDLACRFGVTRQRSNGAME
jgi:RNA polymerase sigma-70 factor (ECF subfamily)